MRLPQPEVNTRSTYWLPGLLVKNTSGWKAPGAPGTDVKFTTKKAEPPAFGVIPLIVAVPPGDTLATRPAPPHDVAYGLESPLSTLPLQSLSRPSQISALPPTFWKHLIEPPLQVWVP